MAERVKYKLCILIFRCTQGIAPSYLADSIRLTSSIGLRNSLRSADTLSLDVPRTRLSFGDRAFVVAGPRTWNIYHFTCARRSQYLLLENFFKNSSGSVVPTCDFLFVFLLKRIVRQLCSIFCVRHRKFFFLTLHYITCFYTMQQELSFTLIITFAVFSSGHLLHTGWSLFYLWMESCVYSGVEPGFPAHEW